MKHSGMLLAGCLLAGLVSSLGAMSNDDDERPASSNPYQAIADRNTFGLKPPPPPPEIEKPKAPPPKFTLTGFTTRKGKKTVYLKAPGTPGKPGEAAKEHYYAIPEGDEHDGVEVVEINEKAGTVRIKFEGTEVPLNFVDNGAKLVSPPPGFVPGQGAIPAPGGGLPHLPSATGPASNVRPLPTRTLRLPTPTGGNSAAPGVGMVAPGQNHYAAARIGQNQLSAEQQIVMVEMERERTKEAVAAGVLPPLPPTPLSPPGSPGTGTPDGPPGLPPIPQ